MPSILRRQTTADDDHAVGSPSYGKRAATSPRAIQRSRLMSLLQQIDARIAAIDERLRVTPPGAYLSSELSQERSDLLARRRTTANEIADLDAADQPPTAAEIAKREAYERRVATEVANRTEVHEHFVRKLEAQGELREARIQRMAMLEIDAQVRREWPY